MDERERLQPDCETDRSACFGTKPRSLLDYRAGYLPLVVCSHAQLVAASMATKNSFLVYRDAK